jgi:UDP-N-acetylmuramyl pentapeptide phosphotransferase/UDP-N-acetylglucosamine-1-phosphate transferase
MCVGHAGNRCCRFADIADTSKIASGMPMAAVSVDWANKIVWLALSGALAATWSGLALYANALTRRARLEATGPRSMHAAPLPTGAGIVVMPVVLAIASFGAASDLQVLVLVGAACLTLVSWLDDMVKLPAAPRLLVHAAVVGACTYHLSPDLRAFPWMPLLLERLLEAGAWLWFINLFNFMDGIDGLAGSEAVAIAMGFILLAGFIDVQGASVWMAAAILATMLGYLRWNWPPARLMMGDAGSVPLGFLLGWLMLQLALAGYWVSALILPLYFCADATLTLLGRLRRGFRLSEPHREHFYQRAALGCGSHRPVVVEVLIGNCFLLIAAVIALRWDLLGFALAIAANLVLLHRLANMARQAARP